NRWSAAQILTHDTSQHSNRKSTSSSPTSPSPSNNRAAHLTPVLELVSHAGHAQWAGPLETMPDELKPGVDEEHDSQISHLVLEDAHDKPATDEVPCLNVPAVKPMGPEARICGFSRVVFFVLVSTFVCLAIGGTVVGIIFFQRANRDHRTSSAALPASNPASTTTGGSSAGSGTGSSAGRMSSLDDPTAARTGIAAATVGNTRPPSTTHNSDGSSFTSSHARSISPSTSVGGASSRRS
ncbi:unnamed protein product, partial [Amoebophrya sp. A25]